MNLHSLKGRRLRGDLIETYKIYNKLEDIHWNDLFTNNVNCTRNQDGKIFIKRCNTSIKRNCFNNREANFWNDLPTNLKTAPSTNIFKNQLDSLPKFAKLFRGYDE